MSPERSAKVLRSVVPEGDGIVLIAEVDSIVYAEIDGEKFHAGGCGYLFGNEGSSFGIGKAALQLLARANDGRVPWDLFIEELAAIVPNVRELYRLENPVPFVAQLAPLVLAAAGRGERAASKIVQAAARDLANLLECMPAAQREIPLLLSGELFRENSLLTYLFETRIANEFPLWHVMKNVYAG
jgi:glucosamine kinase